MGFQSGDFESVTLRQCQKRLENVCQEAIGKDDWDCFMRLAEHRNKVMHFFHGSYAGEQDPALIESIVKEQIKASVILLRLLKERWKQEFAPFASQLDDLEHDLKGHKDYLKAKFDLLSAQLQDLVAEGVAVSKCFYCEYDAAQETAYDAPLFVSKCLLCGHGKTVIRALCPECQKVDIIFEEGSGTCASCQTKFNLDSLTDMFGTALAKCVECSYIHESVILYGDHEYLCLCCGMTYTEIGQCEWCSENVAGDMSGSYVKGCGQILCDGALGWDDD